MLSLEGHQSHFLISLGSRETGREEIRFLVGKIRKSTTPLLAWHRRCCPMGALGSEPPTSSWHDRGLSRAGLPVPCPVQSLPTGMEGSVGCQPRAERWQSSFTGNVHCRGCWVQPYFVSERMELLFIYFFFVVFPRQDFSV